MSFTFKGDAELQTASGLMLKLFLEKNTAQPSHGAVALLPLRLQTLTESDFADLLLPQEAKTEKFLRKHGALLHYVGIEQDWSQQLVNSIFEMLGELPIEAGIDALQSTSIKVELPDELAMELRDIEDLAQEVRVANIAIQAHNAAEIAKLECYGARYWGERIQKKIFSPEPADLEGFLSTIDISPATRQARIDALNGEVPEWVKGDPELDPELLRAKAAATSQCQTTKEHTNE